MASPPVAKLMDYRKFKDESDRKVEERRRNDINSLIEEMKGRDGP